MSQLYDEATLLLNSLNRYCSLAKRFQQSRKRGQHLKTHEEVKDWMNQNLNLKKIIKSA